MAFITQDQVKEILGNAPKNVSPKEVIDGLINKGHELEGYPGTQHPEIKQQQSREEIMQESQKRFIQEGLTIPERLKGAKKGFFEAGERIQEKTGELLERDPTIGKGRTIEALGILGSGAADILGSTIGGLIEPEIKIAAEAISKALPEDVKETAAGVIQKADDIWQKLPVEARNALGGAKAFTELLLGGAAPKIAEKTFETVSGVAGDIKNISKQSIETFTQRRKAGQNQKVFEQVDNSVNDLFSQYKVLQNQERSKQFKNTDLRTPMKDPEVFAGIKLENGKVNPDEAISVLEDRVERALNSKRALLPIADQRLPKVTKEEIRQAALEAVPKLTPKGEADFIKRLNEEIDAIPDELSISELDDLRARARGSAVDAKGVQKPDSHFTALENATRDLVFNKVDDLSPDKGAFANLNKYIKDTINTMNFLDTKVRGLAPEGGKLTKLFTRTIGAVAGSGGGVLGSIAGGFAGDIAGDILSNRGLANSVKREILLNLTDGSPEAIQIVDDMMKNLPEIQALPPARGDVRSEVRDTRPIQLRKETESTVEARERERLSPTRGTRGAIGSDVNVNHNIEVDLLKEAKKFDTAEDFRNRIGKERRKQLSNMGIRSLEQYENFFKKAGGGIDSKTLNTLNPTGNILVEYDPKFRATAELGKNITTLDKTMWKSPNDTIVIYRGVPSGVSKINPGDFITTNKELAESYTGSGNVISKQVKLSEILDDVTEPLGEEYIYRPKN